ncbi:hypothetical protein [Maridesulfovibrio sp.]|uniref:hypothetical protein n=1 Tax=Maridesulfovibrio sp. TaxID=2795000 RepID=UPI0039EF8D69
MKKIILFFVFIILNSTACAPRINTDRFDLTVMPQPPTAHKQNKHLIKIWKPDDSALQRIGNDTLIRRLEIPDLGSNIIFLFVTPSNVSDWCADVFKKTFQKNNFKTALVSGKLSVEPQSVDIKIVINKTRVGCVPDGFAAIAGAKIDLTVTAYNQGEKILSLNITGNGEVEYNDKAKELLSISQAFLSAMQEAADLATISLKKELTWLD